jgi:hypothetical protein
MFYNAKRKRYELSNEWIEANIGQIDFKEWLLAQIKKYRAP